ncbi:hypothetical protein TNCV_4925311 [Trichonephila clavipes]|nr:hypothetical protein TNCV_4925311 [Trichonephila clavipes]
MPRGRVVVFRASTPQIGEGKADSAFHPLSGLINEYQAFLGTKHLEFHVKLTTRPEHLIKHLNAYDHGNRDSHSRSRL